MELLIGFAIITVILIVPIKIAASMVGAQRTGIFYCFGAIFVSAVFQAVVALFIPQVSDKLGVLLSLPIAAFAYSLILGTTFLKGIGIAIIQVVITIGILFLLALFFSGI